MYENGEKLFGGLVRMSAPSCVWESANTLPTIEVPCSGFRVSFPEYLFWKNPIGKSSPWRGPSIGWKSWLILTRSYAPKNQTLSFMMNPPRSAPNSWRTSFDRNPFGPSGVWFWSPWPLKSDVRSMSMSERMPVSL